MPQVGPFCFKNTTGRPVTDLHIVFTGTGGTLRRGRLTAGPAGGIRASGNEANVVWNAAVPPGGVVCLSVWSRHQPIQVYLALWTFNFDPVGVADQIPKK